MSTVEQAPHTPVGTDDVSERGAILMFVLVLVTFVGLGVSPVLAAVLANTRTTLVAQTVDNGFYAADGGVEYAIQAVRAKSVDCSQSSVASYSLTGAGSFFGTITLEGLPVTVSTTCSTSSSPTLINATITSSAGGVNQKLVTATAVVSVNVIDPNKAASVVSWSSVQS